MVVILGAWALIVAVLKDAIAPEDKNVRQGDAPTPGVARRSAGIPDASTTPTATPTAAPGSSPGEPFANHAGQLSTESVAT